MPLTEDQKRPVLAIDLGASHTKLAWRPGWTDKNDQPLQHAEHFFNTPSVSIEIDGHLHIPSIALQAGTPLDWHFGTDAASLIPSPGRSIQANWKSVLFSPKPSELELKNASLVAKGFFEWLHTKLKNRPDLHDFHKCAIALCVPALAGRAQSFKRVTTLLNKTPWHAHPVWQTLEPRANIVGLSSSTRRVRPGGKMEYSARNHVTFATHRGFAVDLGQVYGPSNPLISWARQTWEIRTSPKKVGIIDIGAFTTDFAVCKVLYTGEVQIDEKEQHSIRHGVSFLDKKLYEFVSNKGLDPTRITHRDFSLAQEAIYKGDDHQITDRKKKLRVTSRESAAWIADFTGIILTQLGKQTQEWKAFVLTGGGAAIPLVREKLENALNVRGVMNLYNRFDDIDTRIATAMGAASVELQNWNQIEVELPSPAPNTPNVPVAPAGRDCTCGGKNKDCQKCDGIGWIKEPIRVTQHTARPTRRVTPLPTNPASTPTASTRATARRSVDRRASASTEDEAPPVVDSKTSLEIGDIMKVWNEPKALDQFTLKGWMGKLVFGQSIKQEQQRRILSDMETVEGKDAWLRLLCLATCFSVRAKPSAIKKFWNESLEDVWTVLIPTSIKKPFPASYIKKLDQVFVTAIHHQFNDQNASGEDAELWRRVFYDFRKLHHFVYRNDFVDCLFYLVNQPRSNAHTLVNFMKSGKMPGNHGRWVGVLGQSMTSPLFFLLRELRRLEILDSRFDKGCFYINSPVRRLATRLGWISAAPNTSYGIDQLEEFAEICQTRMVKECPDLGSFFDLPFQWYAHQNPR
jgi:hypothetical protein